MTLYNEIDPFAANWLQSLMDAGEISPGPIERRPIEDLKARELEGYTRAHFFAGIGGWDLALKLAGWPQDRPVWTGSCPCQPFSAAGQRKGVKDKRHLWPYFAKLIGKCLPPVIFGEQVASSAGRDWLSRVRADLEKLGYAFGAADLCAAGVGAPHIRQRLYWVAHNPRQRWNGRKGAAGPHGRPGFEDGGRLVHHHQGLSLPQQEALQGAGRRGQGRAAQQPGGAPGRMAHADGPGQEPTSRAIQQEGRHDAGRGGAPGGLAHGGSSGRGALRGTDSKDRRPALQLDGYREAGGMEYNQGVGRKSRGPESGRRQSEPRRGKDWEAYDLIPCKDGKDRRVESGSFPLAYGVPGRVGLLRGYGNAIVPPLAAQFVKTVMEYLCP